MESADDRQSAASAEIQDQRVNLKLMSDVEKSGGLVKQKDLGLLSQRTSEYDPLFLSAAQFVEITICRACGRGIRLDPHAHRFFLGMASRSSP